MHISQFYYCARVESYAELQYIVEVGKQLYYRNMYGISINGISISTQLQQSAYWKHFQVACKEGWVTDYNGEIPNYPIYIDEVQNILMHDVSESLGVVPKGGNTPITIPVELEKKSKHNWCWDSIDDNGEEINEIMTQKKGSLYWLSFVAFMTVYRYIHNRIPARVEINVRKNVIATPYLLADLLNLLKETDCVKWVDLVYEDESITELEKLEQDYLAWLHKGKVLGIVGKDYTVTEKRNQLHFLNIVKNDVVYLYTRQKSAQKRPTQYVTGFYPIIIDEINDEGITFWKINNRRTKAQAIVEYREYNDEVKEVYGRNKQLECSVLKDKVTWQNVGIEYYMNKETNFITPCYDEDVVKTIINNDKGELLEITMQATNLLYWILKEYNILFNEDRFLQRYFKHQHTLYEIYHS